MTFDEYQNESRKTAIYPNKGDNLPYLALGITGEAGEVSEAVNQFIRDTQFAGIGDLGVGQKRELALEIGDVMWYVAQVATELGFSLEEIAEMNIAKTQSRIHQDKLGGAQGSDENSGEQQIVKPME